MSEDIINALRLASERVKATVGSPNLLDEAADELEKVQAEADRLARRNALLVAEIETVREERDEARREVCSMNETGLRMNASDKKREAKRRAWDCFKETP